ncbi:MAG: hypothetical protein WA136_11380 [Rhodoferax sp.]
MVEHSKKDASKKLISDIVVPDDYPRDPYPAALGGAQPKFAARLIDGRYVAGLTDEERRERYLFCVGWVDTLVEYFPNKRLRRPDMSVEDVMQYIHAGIRSERGDLGEVELDWIMAKLRARVLPNG